jgi:Suppressor of fused protein (SUFU)
MSIFRRGREGNVERSAGGSRIYRHDQPAASALSAGDAGLIEAVSQHLEDHFGSDGMVWHQMLSEHVHVDIHVTPPADDRPWLTLVTTGLSERPMAAPKPDLAYAELVMALPPDWPTDREQLREERYYWPFRLLQDLAVLPHKYDTFLSLGHTIPNGDPPEPYAESTDLCGVVLLPPLRLPDGFAPLQCGERRVNFLGVVPLHADEMQAKLDHGLDVLIDPFDQAGVTELLDPARASALA